MCPVLPEGLCTVQRLRLQEFECFFVDVHILPEGDGRGLCPRHEMTPAPRLTGSVKLFHHGLVVLKDMHFREAVVADNFGEPRNEGGCVVATVDIVLGKLHGDLHLRDRPQLAEIGHGCPVNRRRLRDLLADGIQQFLLRPIGQRRDGYRMRLGVASRRR